MGKLKRTKQKKENKKRSDYGIEIRAESHNSPNSEHKEYSDDTILNHYNSNYVTIVNNALQDMYNDYHNRRKFVSSVRLIKNDDNFQLEPCITQYFKRDDYFDCADWEMYGKKFELNVPKDLLDEINTVIRFVLHSEQFVNNPLVIKKIERKDEKWIVTLKQYRKDENISFYDGELKHKADPKLLTNDYYYLKYTHLNKAIKQGEEIKSRWSKSIDKEKKTLDDLKSVEQNDTIKKLVKSSKNIIHRYEKKFKKLESYHNLKKEMEKNLKSKSSKELQKLGMNIHIDFFM